MSYIYSLSFSQYAWPPTPPINHFLLQPHLYSMCENVPASTVNPNETTDAYGTIHWFLDTFYSLSEEINWRVNNQSHKWKKKSWNVNSQLQDINLKSQLLLLFLISLQKHKTKFWLFSQNCKFIFHNCDLLHVKTHKKTEIECLYLEIQIFSPQNCRIKSQNGEI